MISKLGLDDWKWALPAGLFIGIPIVNLEVNLILIIFYHHRNASKLHVYTNHLHITIHVTTSQHPPAQHPPAQHNKYTYKL